MIMVRLRGGKGSHPPNVRALHRLRRNKTLLLAISQVSEEVAKELISSANKDLILTLVEIVMNIIRGNVRLTPHQFKKFSRHADDLDLLVRKNTSMKKKKELLQHGGFLGLLSSLLGPVIQGVTSLFSGGKQ